MLSNATINGSSATHGLHHVAQKLIKKTESDVVLKKFFSNDGKSLITLTCELADSNLISINATHMIMKNLRYIEKLGFTSE